MTPWGGDRSQFTLSAVRLVTLSNSESHELIHVDRQPRLHRSVGCDPGQNRHGPLDVIRTMAQWVAWLGFREKVVQQPLVSAAVAAFVGGVQVDFKRLAPKGTNQDARRLVDDML